MFKLVVLNSEADWAEKKLSELGRIFYKHRNKYTTVFFNKNQCSNPVVYSDRYLGTAFIKVFKAMPAFIQNDDSRWHEILTARGEYTSKTYGHDTSWKTQSERFAKIQLYQLTSIPQQEWKL